MPRWLLFVGLIVAVVGVSATVLAQDDEEGGGKKTKSWFALIIEGSTFMGIGFIIMILSVISIALIVEHFMSVKKDALVPPEIVARLEELLDDGAYEDARTLCESAPNFLTNVVYAGLLKLEMERPYEEIEMAMQEAGDQEAVKLHQKISYLSLLGNVSPMMGLFGTVAGMIAAFAEIAGSKTSPEPQKLAYGIMTALVTTFLGLLVAIPSITAYFFFRNKVIRIIMEVGAISEELMERFRPQEESVV